MNSRFAAAAAIVLPLLAAPWSANAATIQFNTTLDLTACGSFFHCIQPMATQQIANGDLVDYTVDFSGLQQLTLHDDAGGQSHEVFRFWFGAGDNNSSFTISDISVELIDQVGVLVNPLSAAAQSSGAAHLGPYFSGDFVATGSSLSFSGFRVQFTVDSIAVSPHSYSNVWFGADADRELLAITAVPEPATLWLLGIGVAGAARCRLRVAGRRL